MQQQQLQVDDLPPELWRHVLEHLQSPDQRTCRLVSHAFCELATSFVFSRITVKFGDWDVWYYDDQGEDVSSVMLDNAATAEDESFGVLEYIAAREWLAGAVRHLEVQAFQVYVESAILAKETELTGEYTRHCCQSPLCDARRCTGRLTAALRSLRQLRSFIWHGDDPHPTFNLVITLSTSCPCLQDLSLP